MTQGRAQLQHIKIGGSQDGRILAYRIDVIQERAPTSASADSYPSSPA